MFTCDKCNKEYKNKGSLKRHYNEKHCKGHTFKCEICSSEFKRKERLLRHFRTNHLSLKYKCEHCGDTFNELYFYNVHMKTVHNNRNDNQQSSSTKESLVPEKIFCYICNDKCYTRISKLITHIITNHSEIDETQLMNELLANYNNESISIENKYLLQNMSTSNKENITKLNYYNSYIIKQLISNRNNN